MNHSGMVVIHVPTDDLLILLDKQTVKGCTIAQASGICATAFGD